MFRGQPADPTSSLQFQNGWPIGPLNVSWSAYRPYLPTILRVPWNNVTSEVKIHLPRMLTTLVPLANLLKKTTASELLLGSFRAAGLIWHGAIYLCNAARRRQCAALWSGSGQSVLMHTNMHTNKQLLVLHSMILGARVQIRRIGLLIHPNAFHF
jgi:hypothetical protein